MTKRSDTSFFQLTADHSTEESAHAYFERKRWPNGPRCSHCHSADVLRMNTKRKRPVFICHGCGKQFSVTTGTVMEDTRLPLRKWLLAFHLIGSSKKGISGHQLSRMLDVSYQTAWHLGHRIRATMTENSQFFAGGIVETDETYVGGKRKHVGKGYRKNKKGY